MSAFALVTEDSRSRMLTPAGPRLTVSELRKKLRSLNQDAIVYACVDGSNFMAINPDRVLAGGTCIVLGWVANVNDLPEEAA